MSDFLELKSRIAVLDQNDAVVGFLDNELPDALPFWDDELHEYLEGASNTFTFKTDARHDDSLLILEGYKIAFKTSYRDYYLNVVKTIRDEDILEVEAWSTNLELTNETVEAFDCQESWSFVQYKNQFDAEGTIQIGVNEVSDKRIKNKWDGESTVLSRLYSLANVFDAEIEFVPHLNADYSLNRIVMNVYREHSDKVQGIGKANSLNVVYGKDINGIKKTSDITDLYTCIYPKGGTPEGSETPITLNGYSAEQVKDANGHVLYFLDGDVIRAPQARDRFPSYSSKNSNDRYILIHWSCDVLDKATLYGRALAELKKNCEPKVTYEIDGYVDTGIGDTVRITDFEYNPTLYLEARVTEQVRSFTDPSRNKTTYSNINVLQSQIDSSLLARVQALIQASKTFIGEIITDNGIQFVNGLGSSTLTARVLDGVVNIVEKFNIKWFKDGVQISTDQSILVDAGDFGAKALYRFEAYQDGKLKSQCEVTMTNVADGEDGKDGLPSYLHVRYSNDGGLTFTGNNGKTGGDWMGTYTDHIPEDSEFPTDYTWTKVKGPTGQSLVSMIRQYYLSSSDTTQIDGAWLNQYPTTFDAEKYLWMRWRATYENPSAIVTSEPELDLTWVKLQESLKKAQEAIDKAEEAKQQSASALETAGDALDETNQIREDLVPIQDGIDEAKDLANEAKAEIAQKTEEVLADIADSYATKSDVTELEGELKAKIIADATQIATNVSETVTQNNQAKIDSLLLGFNEELATKVATLDELTSNKSEALKTLMEAKETLADLEKDMDDLLNNPDATQAQINTLQNAINQATSAVNDAEDVVNETIEAINDIREEIEDVAKNSVQALMSRVTNAETAIVQNAQEIALKANQTTVNSAIDGLKTELEGKITVEAGKIQQAVNSINTVSNKVDNIKVGARNYLLDSDVYITTTSENTSPTSKAFNSTLTDEDKGKQFILSVYVDTLGEGENLGEGTMAGRCGIHTSETWKDADGVISTTYANTSILTNKNKEGRFSTLYTVPTKEGCTLTKMTVSMQLYYKPTQEGVTFKVGRPKLELGTIPTDWSPAPEDIDENISTTKENLEDKIDGTKENLQGMIDSTEERLSSFVTQTATSIEQEVNQQFVQVNDSVQVIREASSILSQKYDSFEMSFNEFKTIVNTDASLTNNELATIKKFIRFVDGNILLGEEGNAQMLKISKDRISFLQGNNEVAYISNNTLYIYDGVFLNSLRIQNYVWLPRANGHLSLKKVR